MSFSAGPCEQIEEPSIGEMDVEETEHDTEDPATSEKETSTHTSIGVQVHTITKNACIQARPITFSSG